MDKNDASVLHDTKKFHVNAALHRRDGLRGIFANVKMARNSNATLVDV